jgi:hypothetical protein
MAVLGKAAMIRRVGFLIFALAALAPAAATADSQGNALMKKWASSDFCSRQAYRKFPDFTPDSLAKRDQSLKQCLAGNNLPPRDLPAPNQP